MVVHLGELCSKIGAAVALRALRGVAREVRDVRVTLANPKGTVDLNLFLGKDAP
jgi:hypothetical protein